MGDRMRPRALDGIAHGLGPPCLAAAFLLYFFVPWVPSAFPRPELLCGSLFLVGVGSTMITMRAATRRLRVAGATVILVGLVAVLGTGLW